MSIFEIIMLICFGFAWPLSISKSYRSRTTRGKSLFFLVIIQIGYLAGIVHKYLHSRDLVMILYALNLTMVSIDVGLYFRNKRIEQAQASQTRSQQKAVRPSHD